MSLQALARICLPPPRHIKCKCNHRVALANCIWRNQGENILFYLHDSHSVLPPRVTPAKCHVIVACAKQYCHTNVWKLHYDCGVYTMYIIHSHFLDAYECI